MCLAIAVVYREGGDLACQPKLFNQSMAAALITIGREGRIILVKLFFETLPKFFRLPRNVLPPPRYTGEGIDKSRVR